MDSIEILMKEASKLSDPQRREIVAMAKGMDAANQLNQNREEH